MKQYKFLLFDLDGTITDSQHGIINSFMYVLDKFNIKVTDKTELKPFLGPPLTYTFQNLLGFSEEDAALGIKYYREYYREHGIFDNMVYDGIPELLDSLNRAGYKLILATSKPEKFAVQILEHFGLLKYFDFTAGSTMDDARSAKADVITYALASCGITDLSEVVMIGDREHDILGAKNASAALPTGTEIDSIGVLYGYGDRDELERAGETYIAETVQDLAAFLL